MSFDLHRLFRLNAKHQIADSGNGSSSGDPAPASTPSDFAGKVSAAKDVAAFQSLRAEALANPALTDTLLDRWKDMAHGLQQGPADFWRELLIEMAEKTADPVATIRNTTAKLGLPLRQTVLDECLLGASYPSNSETKQSLYTGWFLDAGGNPASTGSAALIYAAANRNEDLVRRLVDKGASFTDALRRDRTYDYSTATRNLLHYQKKFTGKDFLPETDPAVFDTLTALREDMARMTEKIGHLEDEVKTLKKQNPPAP